MSFSRFLNDLKQMDHELDQIQAQSNDRFHHSDYHDFVEQRLDELLLDLTDFSESNGDGPLTIKLRSLQRDDVEHSFHQRNSLTEVRARILRIIRVLETFGQSYLEPERTLRAEDVETVNAQLAETLGNSVTNKVFVVHGHDNAVLFRVKETLTTLDLKPIVLREQANGGKTIIEKFEQYSDVGFAVVLMTGDDMGGSLAEIEGDSASPRARQNVIMELGFFASKLGRSRICVLKDQRVEAPSDIMGVVYTPIDDAEAWRLSLAKELDSAGYVIDLNKLI